MNNKKKQDVFYGLMEYWTDIEREEKEMDSKSHGKSILAALFWLTIGLIAVGVLIIVVAMILVIEVQTF